MRRLVLVLLCSVSLAEAGVGPVVQETMNPVSNLNLKEVRQICGSGVDIRACSAFRSERLSTVCRGEAERWRIEASASYDIVMFLSDNSWIEHEMLHIADVRYGLTRYIRNLETREFDSQKMCEGVARIQSMVFPQLMNRLKDDSNAKRHPGYVRQSRFAIP